MDKQLIFDIGFHRGEDTSYYLYRGYRVVAVDADEELIDSGRKHFEEEIKNGRLRLLNVAISTEKQTSLPFYISQNKLWNSVHKGIAERGGTHAMCKRIASDTLLSLMEQYGVPYYCKIDIEGNDIVALQSLKKAKEIPLYISVETECLDDDADPNSSTFETLDALKDLGYEKFKLVDQSTLKVLDGSPFYSKPMDVDKIVDNALYGYNLLHQPIGTFFSDVYPCTSGPFGLDLQGEWCDYERAKQLLAFYSQEQRKHSNAPVWHFWCDWHATY